MTDYRKIYHDALDRLTDDEKALSTKELFERRPDIKGMALNARLQWNRESVGCYANAL